MQFQSENETYFSFFFSILQKEFRTESEVTANKNNLEIDNNEVLRSKNDVDKILSFVFAFIAFLFGLIMSEIEIPIGLF